MGNFKYLWLALGTREPVSKDLCGGEPAPLERHPDCLGRLAVLLQIRCGEPGSGAHLLLDQAIDLPAKARTALQQKIDLAPRLVNRGSPSGSRFSGGRDRELQEMSQNAC